VPDITLLLENEDALATALLPDDPDPTQPLTSRDQFLTHAYLVLSCALIEEFIESAFQEYVEGALAASTESEVAPCFVPLAARFATDAASEVAKSPTASHACPALSGLYVAKVIRPNNGIKPRNLATLAKPLGLQEELEAQCQSLLVPAGTLGARRGVIAHLGTITEELRPADARKLVLDVTGELPLLLSLLSSPSGSTGTTAAAP
jgi:hypothetical protein